jgi:hypothetical protein
MYRGPRYAHIPTLVPQIGTIGTNDNLAQKVVCLQGPALMSQMSCEVFWGESWPCAGIFRLADRDWSDSRTGASLKLDGLHDEGKLVDLLCGQLIEL